MHRLFLILWLYCLVVSVPTALANHTPNPSSVTIAGSLQSELGCAGDWDPACAATHLTYDAGDDVWQGTWTVSAGVHEYKAALNDNWTENYGLHAASGGANIPLALGANTSVKFYYDHKTHWITDNHNSIIATVPGSFQSELGCPAIGNRTACAPGSRIRMAMASIASAQTPSLLEVTNAKWLSTKVGLRIMGRVERQAGPISPSLFWSQIQQ